MAKRFIDTDIFKKQFIRSLEAPYKLLWIYILQDCNHAGIWEVDIEVAKIKLSVKLTKEKATEVFKDKIRVLNGGSKWFIPDFITFQYGELRENNRAHINVISVLKKEGLLNEDLSIKLLSKPLTSPLHGAKEKEQEQVKEKETEKEKDAHEKKVHRFEFVPPTLTEVETFFSEKGFSKELAKQAFEHYQLADWHDTQGTKVQNWKQKMNTNWLTPERKQGYGKNRNTQGSTRSTALAQPSTGGAGKF